MTSSPQQQHSESPSRNADILILGGGIAGASAAWHLAPDARVIVLERESQPGYHATGRSAALYSATYGNACVRAITAASRDFYLQPPDGFAAQPLLTPRGTLIIGSAAQREQLQAAYDAMRALVPDIAWLDQAQILARVPVLRPEAAAWAVYEPDAMDMDTNAIHQGFLRGMKAHRGELVCDAEVQRIAHANGIWQVETTAGRFAAPIVINAAGAWCDLLAQMAGVAPIGLVPKRRTAFTFAPPAGLDSSGWPMVIDIDEQFYFKPDAGVLLASPANEDPVVPQDVQPEELDVAIAADRIETVSTLKIGRVLRKWAGLRSFVADKTPVAGFAADADGFFWLAGQGGYGIQTAPALGRIAAALVRRQPVPAEIGAFGVDAADLSPQRNACRPKKPYP
jgi:D-arginine dehydrogenase